MLSTTIVLLIGDIGEIFSILSKVSPLPSPKNKIFQWLSERTLYVRNGKSNRSQTVSIRNLSYRKSLSEDSPESKIQKKKKFDNTKSDNYVQSATGCSCQTTFARLTIDLISKWIGHFGKSHKFKETIWRKGSQLDDWKSFFFRSFLWSYTVFKMTY
jgi:hypothetical protein